MADTKRARRNKSSKQLKSQADVNKFTKALTDEAKKLLDEVSKINLNLGDESQLTAERNRISDLQSDYQKFIELKADFIKSINLTIADLRKAQGRRSGVPTKSEFQTQSAQLEALKAEIEKIKGETT